MNSGNSGGRGGAGERWVSGYHNLLKILSSTIMFTRQAGMHGHACIKEFFGNNKIGNCNHLHYKLNPINKSFIQCVFF